jgi:hypothetical protein
VASLSSWHNCSSFFDANSISKDGLLVYNCLTELVNEISRRILLVSERKAK